LTTGAIKAFQKAQGLEDTGIMDSKTHDLLAKHSSVQESAAAMQAQLQAAFGGTAAVTHAMDAADLTGVAVSDDSWRAETQSLGQFSQDVIAKVISSETNQRTLKSVGKVLGDAGYPKAAAAVLAKSGGAAATTGFFPDPYYGYYPLVHGPWWADHGQWW
jgi:peptidoglycan hydrolase-like protein with peptidoglycan-binding domain